MTEYAGPTEAQIKIHANLDELERDSEDIREPYGFVLGGKVLQASDPADLDWQVLMDSDGEIAVLKKTMSDEHLGVFLDQKMPAWKLREFMKDYFAHFGIEEPGKAD